MAMCWISFSATAQFMVTGKVKDTNDEPLIGVSILVKGTTRGTVSDFDGSFRIEAPGTAASLEFSYTGFRQELQEVSATNNNIEVVMTEDITNLEEIVVTGLASSIKRSNLANAVSTVSSKELTGVTTQQTIDGALYGKLTGVNIVQTTGAPGGGIAMRLRGVSSLTGNNQPLFIIDGVYVSNAEIPSGLRFASGANAGNEEGASNRIADLNPADIESIEVLKGASAAAIYGTRANAGVVIITTKKGASGQTKVSLEQDLGFNSAINLVGRRSFTAEQVEAEFSAAERQKFEAAQAAGKVYDYEKEIYGEKGLISDTRLKVAGGNNKTTFFASGAFRNEDGIIKYTGYDRLTLRLNLSHEISDNLRLTTSTNYVNSYSNRGFTGNENEGGLSYGYNLAFTRDWVDLFPDENGVYPDNPNTAGNPIFVRDKTKNEERINRMIQGIKLDWTALQRDNYALRFALNGGLDFFLNETFVYVPETHQAQRNKDNGFIGAGKNKVYNYNYQAFGVFDYYTGNNISFSTQAGISYLNFERDLVFNKTTQLIPLQTNLTQGGTQEITQRLESEEEFGIVAQEEVNIDDKIILTAGIRLDKSSLNGDPNKYFAFPRASVAVNIANFDFWKINAINQFKLRAAYGQTGNSAAFGSLFTSMTPTNISGTSGFIVNTQQGNPGIEPETSTELEFGADFSMFQSKLGLEITYYQRNVENLLYQRSLPTSSGFTNEIRNDLDLKNNGLEVSLQLNPVRTSKINWTSGVNFWFNRSEITRLGIKGEGDANDIPSFVPPGVAFGLGLGTFYIDEGSPITSLWGSGPVQVGDVEPDFQLGWFNQLTLMKNLDFNFLVHWKQGGDVLNLTRLLTDLGATTPREFGNLEGFIEDASYFRLREIGLFYTIPMGDKFLESIRLGVSGRNLLTLTDYSSYDPEVSTKGGGGLSNSIEVAPFPSAKQAYFHLSLNF
ncbi:MAG: SusC/RagA family TonB-linked outer membrane protein [Saprospiraceae bacterium]|nr:SusC/RagA family TonB-linked outer membrane protein [Saprospiraceae bacterium]